MEVSPLLVLQSELSLTSIAVDVTPPRSQILHLTYPGVGHTPVMFCPPGNLARLAFCGETKSRTNAQSFKGCNTASIRSIPNSFTILVCVLRRRRKSCNSLMYWPSGCDLLYHLTNRFDNTQRMDNLLSYPISDSLSQIWVKVSQP